MSTNRLKFVPELSNESSFALEWRSILECEPDFTVDFFEAAVVQLIDHPEYNSTLILRSETIQISDHSDSVPHIEGYAPIRTIHRRLLPRRPTRDLSITQFCTFYVHESDNVPSVLVLTPDSTEELPYYHPSVSHLAILYLQDPPRLRIDVLPLPDTPTDPASRLHRTCLALLEAVHRYGWGARTHYRKRVHHDVLVPREAYQDTYLLLRARYTNLVGEWKEVTDPLKHVFEDIGIATFLMLLWKDTYAQSGGSHPSTSPEELTSRPWLAWPRPTRGFLDLGCGNGLLVHILVSEGYAGYGIDVRERMSWEHYPSATRERLRVCALDPTMVPSITEDVSGDILGEARDANDTGGTLPLLPSPGTFLIGNHADELTPWLPVLAAQCRADGYVSVPCCSWALDGRFVRGTKGFGAGLEGAGNDEDDEDSDSDKGASERQDEIDIDLGTAFGPASSTYAAYRTWLTGLSVHCGWKVECEVLRIPSTRNWAIVGRRHANPALGKACAEALVEGVRARGSFRVRVPEGKGH